MKVIDYRTITIQDMNKGKLPRLPFVQMAETILGKKYELSIVFATKKVSQKLNREFRGKNKPTNILSFPLSKNSGELVLEPKTIWKQAPDFGMPYEKFIGYLVIHGMLHLKGMEHGSTMERREKLLKKKFGF